MPTDGEYTRAHKVTAIVLGSIVGISTLASVLLLMAWTCVVMWREITGAC